MLRRDFLQSAAGALFVAGLSTPTGAEETMIMTANAGRSASVNGMNLYYERHGSGTPLVLLHGGLGTIDEIFGRLLPALAVHHEVIAVELQGHGHTPDGGREMTYEAMADDIAALVEHLGLPSADVIGYSVGGGVALQMGLRHPARVRKLVVISAPHANDGWHPEVIAGTAAMDAEAMKQSNWYSAYLRAAPRPEDWPILVRKVSNLMSSRYDWSDAIGNQLKSPVLHIVGDADSVRLPHALALYDLVGGGKGDGFAMGRSASRLMVVPNTNHLEILERSILAPAILDYLATGSEPVPPYTINKSERI